jgi:hypothetical protein
MAKLDVKAISSHYGGGRGLYFQVTSETGDPVTHIQTDEVTVFQVEPGWIKLNLLSLTIVEDGDGRYHCSPAPPSTSGWHHGTSLALQIEKGGDFGFAFACGCSDDAAREEQ